MEEFGKPLWGFDEHNFKNFLGIGPEFLDFIF